ncbi:cytidyltransferase [Kribbella antibiotica]|uniref:Cytidyltransferase n=1 Tax=Kribbella antibiotica TaxID=190195 RepID=A0A4R4YIL0_9ACTN|nr:adenylyltransferase/cytidyltransferase family protein [Kribbella antibiotica]TDD44626.1 cytidyltransferase [Kribbella antibiotica]
MPQIGYLAGVFDLFHVGHLDVLERARAACGRLVVGVLTDEWAVDAWGARPFVPLVERVQIIEHLRAVDEVVVIDDAQVLTGALVFAADLDGILGVDDLSGVAVESLQELPVARVSRSTILRAAIDQRQSRSSVA